MSRIRFQCATCGQKYDSRKQCRKHQRKQSPPHVGIIQVFSQDKKIKVNKPASKTNKPKKVQKKGDRAKGTRSGTFTRQDGTIHPTYKAGVIRILKEDWEKIEELLPDGARHEIVEETQHHLIYFTGEAYSEIDFLMYENNFCEQEMYYEDLIHALNNYTDEEKIKILDTCELQTSVITEIDNQVIKCAVGEGAEQGMPIGELKEEIKGLKGLAIVYGKFKRPARATTPTYSYGRGKKTTPTKKVGGGDTLSIPKKPAGQKSLNDFVPPQNDSIFDEKWHWSMQAEDIGMGFYDDYYSYSRPTATVSVAPIEPKYHPVYGIKGLELQVDRYVDLTPLIEADEAEVKEAESKMECPPATQDVAINTKNRNATIKNFGYGPLNVDEPGDFWEKIAKQWKTTVKAAKKSKCGNCVAFDESPRMKDCMPGETSDGDGTLGYCWMHHFKCHSARTCDTWAKGGPITTDKVSEGWQERAFAKPKASKVATEAGKATAKASESFEASEGGFKLNVATLPVDDAYEYAKEEFDKRGKKLEDYIPHFYESYQSLQDACASAIDIPRIEMPVIDPEQLNLFQKSLIAGQLDVYRPYAEGRDELYSPKDLYGDTERAFQYLYLGLQDGIIQDDVVDASIVRNSVGLLRPTQSEIWLEKLITNIIQFGNPSEKGGGAFNQGSMIVNKTLAISSDGYILDGHHRFAQIMLVNPSLRVLTLQIGLPIRILLKVATPYGNAIGNDQRG